MDDNWNYYQMIKSDELTAKFQILFMPVLL